MPDSAPVRLPPAAVLDEGLATLFRTLAAQPAPLALIALADQLEDAWSPARIAEEARAIG